MYNVGSYNMSCLGTRSPSSSKRAAWNRGSQTVIVSASATALPLVQGRPTLALALSLVRQGGCTALLKPYCSCRGGTGAGARACQARLYARRGQGGEDRGRGAAAAPGEKEEHPPRGRRGEGLLVTHLSAPTG